MVAERLELTDRTLRGLKPAPSGKRYEIADARLPGLRLRVSDAVNVDGRAASVSFILYARFPPSVKPARRTIGSYPKMSLADARELARAWKRDIDLGINPHAVAEPALEAEAPVLGECFNAVADQFLERHVAARGLRSGPQIRRTIELHVRPILGERELASITRKEIALLLDGIESKAGPVAADKVLANLSKLFNWWATRQDDFYSPIVRGMGRTSPRDRAKTRILNDEEIRAVWTAADQMDSFGGMVQFALLTAQRRAKLAGMRWADVTADGAWIIPKEPREKGNPGELYLPALARGVLEAQPVMVENPYVFAGQGDTAISGFTQYTHRLRKRAAVILGREMPSWSIHDLRRTARSLMARAGVRPDISERVLGHAITGVEGIYDRYTYRDEKTDALQRLATLVSKILTAEGEVAQLSLNLSHAAEVRPLHRST